MAKEQPDLFDAELNGKSIDNNSKNTTTCNITTNINTDFVLPAHINDQVGAYIKYLEDPYESISYVTLSSGSDLQSDFSIHSNDVENLIDDDQHYSILDGSYAAADMTFFSNTTATTTSTITTTTTADAARVFVTTMATNTNANAITSTATTDSTTTVANGLETGSHLMKLDIPSWVEQVTSTTTEIPAGVDCDPSKNIALPLKVIVTDNEPSNLTKQNGPIEIAKPPEMCYTPLQNIIANRRNLSAALRFLDFDPVSIAVQNRTGRTALHFACMDDKMFPIVDLAIKLNQMHLLNVFDVYHKNPLQYACIFNSIKCVKCVYAYFPYAFWEPSFSDVDDDEFELRSDVSDSDDDNTYKIEPQTMNTNKDVDQNDDDMGEDMDVDMDLHNNSNNNSWKNIRHFDKDNNVTVDIEENGKHCTDTAEANGMDTAEANGTDIAEENGKNCTVTADANGTDTAEAYGTDIAKENGKNSTLTGKENGGHFTVTTEENGKNCTVTADANGTDIAAENGKNCRVTADANGMDTAEANGTDIAEVNGKNCTLTGKENGGHFTVTTEENGKNCTVTADANGMDTAEANGKNGRDNVENFTMNDMNPDLTNTVYYVTNTYKQSLLHLACLHNAIDIVKFFLCDLKIFSLICLYDKFKRTALHYACMYGFIEIVKIIFSCAFTASSISIWSNQFDYTGKTGLHYACINNNQDIILYMLNFDSCNAKIIDNDKKTPIDYLMANKLIHIDIRQRLRIYCRENEKIRNAALLSILNSQ